MGDFFHTPIWSPAQDRKEVTFAAAPFAINSEALDVVNFTYPFEIQPYTLLYRRPRELSRTLLFVNPFTSVVRPKARS
jgi:hypothetical protein